MNDKRELLIAERENKLSELTERYNANPHHAPVNHEYYMKAALELAELAAFCGDVPVGCVIVRDGKIISAECNGRELYKDAAYHAETAAISKACRYLGGWRLTRCTMYVTLEPCPMCAGAIWCARVPSVIIGAKDSRAGAMGSVINLNSYPLNYKPKIEYSVLENECREVLREFFRIKRQNNT